MTDMQQQIIHGHEDRIMLLLADNARLRATLEHIIRESQGVNKGPACAELARRALEPKP